MVRVDDDLAERAIRTAEVRSEWPDPDEWEEGTDPRRMPGLYDDHPHDDEDDPDDDAMTTADE